MSFKCGKPGSNWSHPYRALHWWRDAWYCVCFVEGKEGVGPLLVEEVERRKRAKVDVRRRERRLLRIRRANAEVGYVKLP